MALEQVRDFLRICTDNSILSDVFVEVILSRSFPKEFTVPLAERLIAKLGTAIRRHAGAEDIAHRWTLTADQIDEHVGLIEQACLCRDTPSNFSLSWWQPSSSFVLSARKQTLLFPAKMLPAMGTFRLTPKRVRSTRMFRCRFCR